MVVDEQEPCRRIVVYGTALGFMDWFGLVWTGLEVNFWVNMIKAFT